MANLSNFKTIKGYNLKNLRIFEIWVWRFGREIWGKFAKWREALGEIYAKCLKFVTLITARENFVEFCDGGVKFRDNLSLLALTNLGVAIHSLSAVRLIHFGKA